jgi:hypothetical protein
MSHKLTIIFDAEKEGKTTTLSRVYIKDTREECNTTAANYLADLSLDGYLITNLKREDSYERLS